MAGLEGIGELLTEVEDAILAVVAEDPRRIILKDIDNRPAEYRFTNTERQILIDAVWAIREWRGDS